MKTWLMEWLMRIVSRPDDHSAAVRESQAVRRRAEQAIEQWEAQAAALRHEREFWAKQRPPDRQQGGSP